MSVIYKCKECGGDVEIQENGLGKCLYCGALQTLPKDQDDKIQNLLNRANDYRLICDFDRAIYEYEKLLELNETEPEAHWGLLLSKYGVEYVKDPVTYTYKPTLHRISSVSVFDDVDYQATIKYASPFAVNQYKAEAENIETVMKELLLLAANQDPYDIFISYKEADDITRQRTQDSYLAHDLYNELTAKGYKVFFAPKSLGVGLYEPKIYSAIISSKVMLVLGTKERYFNAVWVKNEWTRFVELIRNGEPKVLIPIYKDMDASDLPNGLAQYQALDMAAITFLPTLFDMIAETVSDRKSYINYHDSSAEDANLERGFLSLEERDFAKADAFFEKALNINPHSSQAYFGKLMIEMHITKQEQILSSNKRLKEYKNFERAVQFADSSLKMTLLQYEEAVDNALKEAERAKKQEELLRLNDREFTTPSALRDLGNDYISLSADDEYFSSAEKMGNRCLEVADEWELYEKKLNERKDYLSTMPNLLLLAPIMIPVGILTLLWGFIIWLPLCFVEWLIQLCIRAKKKSSAEFKMKNQQILDNKRILDSHIELLRSRNTDFESAFQPAENISAYPTFNVKERLLIRAGEKLFSIFDKKKKK